MTELCLKCNVEYKTKKNGVTVEELASFGSYRLWDADLKECPKCGHQIIAAFANGPFTEHFKLGYKESLKRVNESKFFYQWNEK